MTGWYRSNVRCRQGDSFFHYTVYGYIIITMKDMNNETITLLCATALFIGVAGSVYSNPKEMPFYPGERLVYTISWSGIEAGRATLEVLPLEQMDGKEVYHFLLKLKEGQGGTSFPKFKRA